MSIDTPEERYPITERLAWLLLALSFAAPAASQSNRENLLILLLDDVGIE